MIALLTSTPNLSCSNGSSVMWGEEKVEQGGSAERKGGNRAPLRKGTRKGFQRPPT